MILMAFAARDSFFSFSNDVRMARWTSSGISADVRRISSIRESWSSRIVQSQRRLFCEERQRNAKNVSTAFKTLTGLEFVLSPSYARESGEPGRHAAREAFNGFRR